MLSRKESTGEIKEMEQKVVSGIMLTLLLTNMLTLAFSIKPVKAEPLMIIVPDDYETIQCAIGNATDGDIIFVRAGTYYEHVVVDKSVSLVGESRETTIIDGQGTGTVVTIRANGVDISGFTIQNGGQYGVFVEISDGCNINRNIVRENSIGIRLWFSEDCVVPKNLITNNREHGISLDNADSANLTGNTVNENTGIGVLLAYSDNTRIGNNLVENNNDSGILIDYSCNSTVQENTVTGNGAYGIILRFSNISIISQNSATNNVYNGIELYKSNNANVFENNIKRNGYYGVRLNSASNNRIYHNNFIKNTEQVSLQKSFGNTWNASYPSGGNYWSDYNGTDCYSGPYQNKRGSDGIGDTPYVIDENNQDSYPLMKPYPWTPHDLGIVNIVTFKTVVGQGFDLRINVTIFNYGYNPETFNVTAYANATVIQIKTITLTSGNFTTVTFFWNTTGFAKGNYTVSAIADIVLGEKDTADNVFTDGWVIVAMVGDVTGSDSWPDGKVDIRDIAAVAILFGVNYPDSRYNANYDSVDDRKIDIRDIATVTIHFGEVDP